MDSESQTSAIRLGHQIIENSTRWNRKDENGRDFGGICLPRYSDEWITQHPDCSNQCPYSYSIFMPLQLNIAIRSNSTIIDHYSHKKSRRKRTELPRVLVQGWMTRKELKALSCFLGGSRENQSNFYFYQNVWRSNWHSKDRSVLIFWLYCLFFLASYILCLIKLLFKYF